MSFESTSPTKLQSKTFTFRRLALNILALLSLALLLWVGYENSEQHTVLRLFGDVYLTSLGAVVTGGGILGVLAAVLRVFAEKALSKASQQSSKRKLERLEVTAETSSERVKALEHKIETLEIALKRALESNKER
ncbi:MAG: hypothetical protein VKJ04_03210 [Vampirovibrionales bacterium]|nr:hypothetical protein [Vampirovibrionales bacterium]